jgi:hypothetical protein
MSKLETSYDALLAERTQLLKDVAFYKGAMEVVQVEVARLRAALEWYADAKNWSDKITVHGLGQNERTIEVAYALGDRGEKAKAALQGKESLSE